MYKYKNRDEVPEKYKWDLTDLFKNDEEFNKLLEETTKEIETLKDYKNCTKDAEKTLEFLNLEEKINANVQLLYVYSYLKNDEVLGIKENIERKSITLDLYNKLETNTSFFDEELLKLTKEEYNNLYNKCENLKEYRSFLDKIYRKKEHTLSETEENIISKLTNAMDNFADMSSNLLNNEHNYGEVKLDEDNIETITVNNYGKLMRNKNREIRRHVYTNFLEKQNEYASTSAGLLNSYVKGNNTIAKLHKFDNAWGSKLFNLNLETQVFKTLVETVENNVNIYQKYYKLKKKILNLDKLYPYDLGVELSTNNKEYTIEEAQELIKKALKPLGEEYLNKLNKIFTNRYIDYMGYKGKTSEWYSFPTKLKGSKILVSYDGNINSISGIIHELGHSIHQSFIIENNPLEYRIISNLVAEVASLTNECLFSNYLMNNSTNKEERLSGIENMINIIRSNLFVTVREGKIEQKMYNKVNNGGSLSKEYLNELVSESYKLYNGEEIEKDELNNLTWITRSHYYMNFYLYSYSISICVAINVATEILKGNKKMLDNYMKFLSAGSDIWPSDAFKILEIDLTDKKVYENAINYFDELINNFEKIYYDKEGE